MFSGYYQCPRRVSTLTALNGHCPDSDTIVPFYSSMLEGSVTLGEQLKFRRPGLCYFTNTRLDLDDALQVLVQVEHVYISSHRA
jgi:hypothetical protein